MSDSIWKKDLSFRKKKVDDLPETAESLRVKELAFQHKLAEAAQAAALPVVEAPKAAVALPEAPAPKPEKKKKQSIWKKEIGGRKKDKAVAEPVAQEIPAPAPLPPAPVVEVPAPAAPAVEFALAPAPELAPVAVAPLAPSAPTLDVPVEGLQKPDGKRAGLPAPNLPAIDPRHRDQLGAGASQEALVGDV